MKKVILFSNENDFIDPVTKRSKKVSPPKILIQNE